MTREQRYKRRIRSKALANLGGCCNLCNSLSNLEIHHLCHDGWIDKLTGHSRTHVLRASKGDTKGLSLLCKQCHHNETLKHSLIFKLAEIKQLELRYYYCIGGD